MSSILFSTSKIERTVVLLMFMHMHDNICGVSYMHFSNRGDHIIWHMKKVFLRKTQYLLTRKFIFIQEFHKHSQNTNAEIAKINVTKNSNCVTRVEAKRRLLWTTVNTLFNEYGKWETRNPILWFDSLHPIWLRIMRCVFDIIGVNTLWEKN